MAGRFYYGPTVDPGHAQFGSAIAAGMSEGRARVDRRRAEEEELRRYEEQQKAIALAMALEADERARRNRLAGFIDPATEIAPVPGMSTAVAEAPLPLVVPRPGLQPVVPAYGGPVAAAFGEVFPAAAPAAVAPVAAPVVDGKVAAPVVRPGQVGFRLPSGRTEIFDPRQSAAAIQAAMEQERAVADEQRVFELNQTRMQAMVDRLTQQGIESGVREPESRRAAIEAVYGMDLPDPYTPITDDEWGDIEKQLELNFRYNTRAAGASDARLRDNDKYRRALSSAEGLARSLYREGATQQQVLSRITNEYGDTLDRGELSGIASDTFAGGFTLENALSHVARTRPMLEDPDTGDPVMAETDPERWRQLAIPLAQAYMRQMGAGLSATEQALGVTPDASTTFMVDVNRISASSQAREGWESLRGVPVEEAAEDLLAAGYSPAFVDMFRRQGWESLDQTIRSAGSR